MRPLRQAVIDAMLVRGYAKRTQKSYLTAIQQLATHYQRSPAKLSQADIQNYFLHVIKTRHWSPASCRLAYNAFRFLYVDVIKKWSANDFQFDLPKRQQRIPVLLSQKEVKNILEATHTLKQRAMLSLCYACGLRVSELVNIKVAEIDGERHLLRITQGKGHKDRQVILPDSLLYLLRQYWLQYHPTPWLFYGANTQKPISISTAQKY